MITLDPFLNSIDTSPLGTAIRESGVLFPWIEGVHVLAISIVLGTIAIVDLRLVGYQSHRRGARQLIKELLPYTWAAFGVAVISGALLFSSNPLTYAYNPPFQSKMIVLLAAGVNMAIFHATSYRRILAWDDLLPPPTAARIAGFASLTLWVVVVFLGRWIGFTLY